MKKTSFIFTIFITLLITISIWGYIAVFQQKNIPTIPPINVDIPTTPDISKKPDCDTQISLDAKLSCEIQYHSENEKRVTHYKPIQQASIYGTREQNNKIIQNHIAKTSHPFFVAGENSYVVVITKQPVAKNRSMMLGLLGRSQGVIYKNNKYNFISDISEDKNDGFYIFKATSIVTMGFGPNTDDFNLLKYRNASNIVNLSFAIGQSGNYVTDIYVINR